MCALKSYYFLEDIAKLARGTQKWHFLIWKSSNSKAPLATDPKLVLWLPTSLSSDMTVSFFFYREAMLSYGN